MKKGSEDLEKGNKFFYLISQRKREQVYASNNYFICEVYYERDIVIWANKKGNKSDDFWKLKGQIVKYLMLLFFLGRRIKLNFEM